MLLALRGAIDDEIALVDGAACAAVGLKPTAAAVASIMAIACVAVDVGPVATVEGLEPSPVVEVASDLDALVVVTAEPSPTVEVVLDFPGC